QLRNLMGLEPYDGRTIVPTDTPTQAPLHIDPMDTMRTALDFRPDIVRQRLNVRRRELELLIAQNARLPQLDLQALYRTNGLEERLDDSLSQMFSHQFIDWQFGASFTMPIGNRAPTANLRAVELQLRRENAMLQQAAHATAHRLSDILRQLESFRSQYDETRIRVRDTSTWLEGSKLRYEDPPPAGDGQDWLLLALNDYLLALRAKTDAATDAAQILAQYNVWLARLEEAKGTLLAAHNVELQDDPAFRFTMKHMTSTEVVATYKPEPKQDEPIVRPSLPAEDESPVPPAFRSSSMSGDRSSKEMQVEETPIPPAFRSSSLSRDRSSQELQAEETPVPPAFRSLSRDRMSQETQSEGTPI